MILSLISFIISYYYVTNILHFPIDYAAYANSTGFWLGATFLDTDYIFDGNLGKVKDFTMVASNKKYFSQVHIMYYTLIYYLYINCIPILEPFIERL